jgi:single-strand DNA-binding protein
MMNGCNLIGRLGRDAEIKQIAGYNALTFALAVEYRKGQEKGTQWYDVTQFSNSPEKLAALLVKGTGVYVQGDMVPREYEGKFYIGVRATQVKITTFVDKVQQPAAPAQRAAPPPPSGSSAKRSNPEDDIPF